ncbi:MAG: XRE family transcriptional regulator [Haliscomenobacteraceae bacterium CHB4]|nr:hypothetical protein [Saprospiraceae bacterium]MCE7924811.1 XRE family transcriptional regulator [Haliscomenobacteraceae bacterium CHB4]
MKESIIERIRARTKPETHIYVRKNLDVAVRVNELLKQKGWTQKDLAKTMGKTESEVSRWLSGLHNITLKSIVKMETVLGADILVVPASSEATSPVRALFDNNMQGIEPLQAVSEPSAKYVKAKRKSND